MAYSYVRYSGNGSTTNYTFSFPTISTDHIKVRVNGTLVTTWSFLSSSTIQFAAAPANAAVIEIRRETPKDSAIVNFTDGSVLLERDLDLLATFDLYLAQETKDGLDSSISQTSLGVFDAQNRRITNVADPVAAQDAVTKIYADAIIAQSAAAATAAAAGSATTATTQATHAASSAVNAANSAAAAATALDNFDDRYLGQKTVDPAVDNDGNALITGALYYNTTDSAMRVYTGTGWINASSAQVATMRTYVYVATVGQTVFSGNDVNGTSLTFVAPYIIVSLNGLELRPSVDYTMSGGSSVTLTSGAAAGDELQIQAFASFNVANIQSADVGFTPSGTGAVATTVQTKLRESISVFDFMTAAQRASVIAGDMVEDVTAPCQAALTAAKSQRQVFFPTGKYKTSAALIAYGGFHGSGSGTIFMPQGTHECFQFLPGQFNEPWAVSSLSAAYVGDLMIQFPGSGNTAGDPSQKGIWINRGVVLASNGSCDNVNFRNMYFRNCYNAIYQGFADKGNVWNCSFRDIIIISPKDYGIYLDLTGNNGSLNVTFDNVAVDYNAAESYGKGVYINGAQNLTFNGIATSRLTSDGAVMYLANCTNADITVQQENNIMNVSGQRPTMILNCTSVEMAMVVNTPLVNPGAGNIVNYIYVDDQTRAFILRQFQTLGETITSGSRKVLNAQLGVGSSTKFTILDGTVTSSDVVMSAGQLAATLWPNNNTKINDIVGNYATGTWLPTLVAESGAFGTITYNSLRGGRYLRIGNLVHIQGLMYTDSVALGTASLEIRIGGLPFTSAASSGSTQDGFCSIAVGASQGWTTNQPSGAFVRASSTLINLTYRSSANGASSNLEVGHITTGTTGNLIRFSGTYIAA